MSQVSMEIGAVRERIAELEEMVNVDDSWLTSAGRVAQLGWAMEELHDQRQLLEELVEQSGHPNNHF